jgi:multidrug transporter EmrE-like cation transporter
MRQWPVGWLMLVGAIAFNTVGNLFIKKFSASSELRGVADYLALPFVIGLVCFGLNLVFYSRALKDIPIAVAYPILVGASVVCIVLVAVNWFGEKFGISHGIGVVLVVAGVALLARTA